MGSAMVAIKDRRIGYLDDLSGDYTKQRQAVLTFAELRRVMARWEPRAGDAFDIVSKMTAAQFRAYRKGERLERRGRYAGDEWVAEFEAILIPEMLLRIALIATRFGVPDGCAFIRAVKAGRFKERDGRFYDTLAATEAAVEELGARERPSGAERV